MEAALRAEAYESLEEDRERPKRIRQVDATPEMKEIKDQIAAIQTEVGRFMEEAKKSTKPGNDVEKQRTGTEKKNNKGNMDNFRPRNGKTPVDIRNIQEQKDRHTIELEQRIKELEEKLKGEENKKKMICYYCNRPGHTSRFCAQNPRSQIQRNAPVQRRNFACYQCGQTGHIAKDCPGNSQNNGAAKPSQQVSTVVTVPIHDQGKEVKQEKDLDPTAPPFKTQIETRLEEPLLTQGVLRTDHVMTEGQLPGPSSAITSPCEVMTASKYVLNDVPLNCIEKTMERKNNRPMALQGKILMDNKPVLEVTFLLDTGADVSIISDHAYDNLKQYGLTSRPTRNLLKAANGSILPTSGEVNLTIEIRGKSCQQSFTIAPIRDDCILGVDFLRKNPFTWDHEEEEITFEDDAPPLRVIETVIIEPKRKVTLLVQVSGGEPGQKAVIVGNRALINKYGLIPTAEIIVVQEEVPIQILNTLTEPVKLPVGTKVGYLYQFHDVHKHVWPREANIKEIKSTTLGSVIPEKLLSELPKELGEMERQQIRRLVENYEDTFYKKGEKLSHTSLVQHRINTGDAEPIKQPPRREPIHLRGKGAEEVKQMLQDGIIVPSKSPWASPTVLVQKKDGDLRYCIDYRRLNAITKKDAYPLPKIAENLDRLAAATWYSALDLKSGYWQIKMHPDDQEKTAFSTGDGGLYEFTVMPFGLTNAPATFERLMETVLGDLLWRVALLYLDDVIVISKTFSEHIEALTAVFQKLRSAGLKLKAEKCSLFQKEVHFLGHIVGQEGVRVDPEKTQKVQQWPVPQTVRQLRGFLGLASYYRRFIKDYSLIAAPLTKLTGGRGRIPWEDEQQQAFEELKKQLVTPPILGYPDEQISFILDTDASHCSIGAVLSQVQEGRERVIAYGGKVLSRAERNYCTTRKELFAVIYFMEHFQHYLIGKTFLVRTDHASLRWLLNFDISDGQMARWIERMSKFHFEIQHRPGKIHGNADALSRQPNSGQCIQCERAECRADGIGNRKWVPKECWAINEGNEDENTESDSGEDSDRESETNGEELPVGERQVERLISREEIMELQNTDEVIKFFVGRTERPTYETVAGAHPEIKYWWARWDQLEWKDGLLTVKWTQDNKERNRIIIPEKARPTIMKHFHNSLAGAHLGVERVTGRLRASSFIWPKLNTDVENWIKGCDWCQLTKPCTKKLHAYMGTLACSQPLERIFVDVMGPLPETPKGNKYVIVLTDAFSKWTECYAVPDHKAKTVASELSTHFFTRFGLPLMIHTDQGRDFQSELFTEMNLLFEIDQTRTSVWHPQSDGQCERFNRTLETMLRQVVAEDQSDWDVYLPHLTAAYRATRHSSTGYTPNMLMLGRELPMPLELEFSRPLNDQDQRFPGPYLNQLKHTIQHSHQVARSNLGRAREKYKKQYDRRGRDARYTVGDQVWLHNPTRYIGKSPKLQVFFDRIPYTIIKTLSDFIVVIRRISDKRERVIHVDHLLPVHKRFQDPVETATSSSESDEVETDVGAESESEIAPCPVKTRRGRLIRAPNKLDL